MSGPSVCGQLAGGGLPVCDFLLKPSSAAPSPDPQGSQAWLGQGKGRGSLGLSSDFSRDLRGWSKQQLLLGRELFLPDEPVF